MRFNGLVTSAGVFANESTVVNGGGTAQAPTGGGWNDGTGTVRTLRSVNRSRTTFPSWVAPAPVVPTCTGYWLSARWRRCSEKTGSVLSVPSPLSVTIVPDGLRKYVTSA